MKRLLDAIGATLHPAAHIGGWKNPGQSCSFAASGDVICAKRKKILTTANWNGFHYKLISMAICDGGQMDKFEPEIIAFCCEY